MNPEASHKEARNKADANLTQPEDQTFPKPSFELPTNKRAPSAASKCHKIEGKNKKSLHQKQQVTLSQQSAKQKAESAGSLSVEQPQSGCSTSWRNTHQKNPSGNKPSKSQDKKACSSLEDFSQRAQELKSAIMNALDKQAFHQIDQPVEVVALKNEILKLSCLKAANEPDTMSGSCTEAPPAGSIEGPSQAAPQVRPDTPVGVYQESSQKTSDANSVVVQKAESGDTASAGSESSPDECKPSSSSKQATDVLSSELKEPKCDQSAIGQTKVSAKFNKASSAVKLTNGGPIVDTKSDCGKLTLKPKEKSPANVDSVPARSKDNRPSQPSGDEFEPLSANLDVNSKLLALVASLKNRFEDPQQLALAVCRKLINLSLDNSNLISNCEKYETENQRLLVVKQKLENLCRELQKSNNAIRIESLDLIKVEQSKAKEQTTKIQSTLSGVIKLFDENQQRNMSLRQENQDLQAKLKSLLDHCDNWEKSVEAALRQRDIENRLLKTELAKANLLKNEEKEKFLGEKQELLQILSMMQEQQHRIEGQEAKLRSDLSSYASKYDECQAVISKGMNRFQVESKRMLKQIEKSRQDYKVLLMKYETTSRKTAQLLEEKQYWDKAMNIANKKIETLEKLCRALRERKLEDEARSANKQKSANEWKDPAGVGHQVDAKPEEASDHIEMCQPSNLNAKQRQDGISLLCDPLLHNPDGKSTENCNNGEIISDIDSNSCSNGSSNCQVIEQQQCDACDS